MKVIVKVVHAAIATGQDPRIEVRRMLLNYRNTPHPSTGKSPAELMIRRPIRTRIPIKMTPLRESTDLEARDKNQQVNKARKLEFDKRKHAKEVTINKGDKILIKQEKSTIKPPYDPEPYVVTRTKGTQVIATRGGKTKIRNKAKVKKLSEIPKKLMPRTHWEDEKVIEDSDDDDVEIDMDTTEETAGTQQGTEYEETERAELQPERSRVGIQTEDKEVTGTEPQESAGAVRKSARRANKPARYRDDVEQNRAKPSPRKRRSIRSRAANGRKKEDWLLWDSLKGWVKG